MQEAVELFTITSEYQDTIVSSYKEEMGMRKINCIDEIKRIKSEKRKKWGIPIDNKIFLTEEDIQQIGNSPDLSFEERDEILIKFFNNEDIN